MPVAIALIIGVHPQGSSSCRRDPGRSAIRARRSASHAFGSTSLIAARLAPRWLLAKVQLRRPKAMPLDEGVERQANDDHDPSHQYAYPASREPSAPASVSSIWEHGDQASVALSVSSSYHLGW